MYSIDQELQYSFNHKDLLNKGFIFLIDYFNIYDMLAGNTYNYNMTLSPSSDRGTIIWCLKWQVTTIFQFSYRLATWWCHDQQIIINCKLFCSTGWMSWSTDYHRQWHRPIKFHSLLRHRSQAPQHETRSFKSFLPCSFVTTFCACQRKLSETLFTV